MNPVFDLGWVLARFTGSVLMGAKISGAEHVPTTGGVILAPNHISYLDPPLAGCYIRRRSHFFAKKELFDIPVLGWIVKTANSHPVRRSGFDRQGMEEAVSVLRAGNMLSVFPEGTRGKNGNILEPKAGVGRIAREAIVPVVPCFIHNAEKFSDCLMRRKRLLISYGEPLSAEWIGKHEHNKESWILIAQEIMRRIKELKRQTLGDVSGVGSGNGNGNDSVDGAINISEKIDTESNERNALSL